jgi:hypothetical protein
LSRVIVRLGGGLRVSVIVMVRPRPSLKVRIRVQITVRVIASFRSGLGLW